MSEHACGFPCIHCSKVIDRHAVQTKQGAISYGVLKARRKQKREVGVDRVPGPGSGTGDVKTLQIETKGELANLRGTKRQNQMVVPNSGKPQCHGPNGRRRGATWV
jgi:hypothetical protein